MSDFKVVLPTTTEEWQRDMKLAYINAIDDFAKSLLSNPVVDKSVVKRVAVQLKAGGENNGF